MAQGWTYLKLDFLYAGAQVGERYADVTGIEAFHIGMQIIREAAGDAWILACGAPFLPSSGMPSLSERAPTLPLASIGIQSSPIFGGRHARRRQIWTNGRWWWIDPDQILVRPPFTDVEATGAVVANAVSGGTWMLGDDLPALSPERLALALNPALVALRGHAARPRDPLQSVSGVDPGPPFEDAMPDDSVPVIWDFDDGTTALLNMGSTPVDVETRGGTELLSGETSGPTVHTLEPGAGEIWVQD